MDGFDSETMKQVNLRVKIVNLLTVVTNPIFEQPDEFDMRTHRKHSFALQ